MLTFTYKIAKKKSKIFTKIHLNCQNSLIVVAVINVTQLKGKSQCVWYKVVCLFGPLLTL